MDKERHRIILEALQSAIGEENVEDSPAIMMAYHRDWLPPGVLNPQLPEFVVLPDSTEQTQKVISICNRYKVPFIPLGSNQWSVTTAPNRPGTLLIDSKRMGRILEIDEKNMYAVIEPYVTLAQIHAEANKRGLYLGSPEASSQSSALAGHVFQGMWGVGHRLGVGHRNILAMEWVLPDGEILRTGSWSNNSKTTFFGEGPGSDLRGILRGLAGVQGGMGMVTRMAIKLHPYPGPKEFPCEGIVPNCTSTLPPELFQWYIIKYPTLEKAVDAMYEISKAEIAGVLQKWPTVYYNWWWANSNQEYWVTWKEGVWQKHCKYAVAVCLWGFTSEKQMEYEKEVLEDIIKETRGKPIPQDVFDKWVPRTANNWIRDTNGSRMMRPSGTFLALRLPFDAFNSSIGVCREGERWVEKFTPPILDCDAPDWISSYDFGHFGAAETDFPVEKNVEDLGDLMQKLMGMMKEDISHKIEGGMGSFLGGPYHAMAGEVFYNYGELLKGIKKAMDPNVVANPPHNYPIEGED
ncbi:MAG: FAD-binding oxidoreductase [Deltaproteobacteria bacterium]|nr:FAD-binding oxidoreductase [Deltaproteobacteria bacterium]